MTFYQSMRDLSLGIAFALLLPLIMHYGITLIQEPPRGKLTGESWQEYTTRRQSFEQFYFYSALTFGVCCIILGTFLKFGFISGGFILGGTFSIIMGCLSIWHLLSSVIRFSLLLGSLFLIVFLALFIRKKEL